MTMDLVEGVGESSSPPRSLGSSNNYDVRTAVFNRLVESGNVEVAGNPDFKEQLDAHFNRLPSSYILDINLDRVEDVLVHQKLLSLARDPTKRPAYHIRFLENLHTESNPNEDQLLNTSPSQPFKSDNNGAVSLHERALTNEFESWSKLEDLNLDVRENSRVVERECLATADSQRSSEPVHEVIFSTVDKPKTLSQLSALLSDIELNIREAHVFSTTDGYSLDVFVVDGWNVEDTDGLYKAMEDAISRSEGSWSGCSPLSLDKVSVPHTKSFGWEIDRSLLEVGDKIASGTYGDLYRGLYLCQDVAVKIYRSEDLTNALEDEFAQEVAILREVQHKNVVRFIGACTRCPHLWIVTEYMPRGSLYSYLQRHRKAMKLSQVLKFAIDVSKGMDYLHQMNIVHRDLKTANLLLDINSVVKVADFGVARFQTEEGVMTAETGTYRWMAPEVINHEPYDQKADVFSFGIVLWELLTAKVPYESMTPLQAAVGVRQVWIRPEIPEDANPKLVELMQRCWDAGPARRPSFSEIMPELEALFSEVTHTKPSSSAL